MEPIENQRIRNAFDDLDFELSLLSFDICKLKTRMALSPFLWQLL